MFLVKYNASGNMIWVKQAGGTLSDNGSSVATDANNNIVVAGDYTSTSITVGTTTLTNADNSGSYSDLFIFKYDPLGNILWAKGAGGYTSDWGSGIATNANGNVFVTGSFKSPTITLGTITLTNSDNNFVTSDVLFTELDPAGNTLWAKSAGTNGYDYGNSICIDLNGNILATGNFQSGSITFGTITLTSSCSDLFLVKMNGVTGITEKLNPFAEINIFPNPGKGQITINSSTAIDAIVITDLPGQIIYQSQSNEKNISIEMIKTGIYFVTLTSGKQTITKKLIID